MKSILANGTMIAGTGWLETLARSAYLIVITRLLGPEGYGLWSYVVAAYALGIGLITFGFEAAVLYGHGGSDKIGNKLAQTALYWRLIVALLAVPAFAAYALLANSEQDVQFALLLVLPALVGRAIAQLVRTIFIANEGVRRSLHYTVTLRIAEVAIGSLMLLAGLQLISILLLHSAIWLLEAIWGSRILIREFGLSFSKPAKDTSATLLRAGAPMAGMGMMMAWLISAPILMFKSYSVDLFLLGQLALALQLGTLLFASAQSFLAAAIPVLSRSDQQGDQRVVYFGAAVAAIALVLCSLAAIILHLFGTPIFLTILGDEYLLASQLVVHAVFVAGLQLLPSGFQQFLIVHKRYWPGLAANLLGCVVMTFGFVWFGAALDPFLAIWIASGAWSSRAILILVIAVIITPRIRFIVERKDERRA